MEELIVRAAPTPEVLIIMSGTFAHVLAPSCVYTMRPSSPTAIALLLSTIWTLFKWNAVLEPLSKLIDAAGTLDHAPPLLELYEITSSPTAITNPSSVERSMVEGYA